MLLKTIAPALAGLLLAASASFAQTAPQPPAPPAGAPPGPMMHMRHFDKADMEKHIAQMCQDRYAKVVGNLAELETRLDLAPAQKPLFARWKDSVLSSTKAHVAECASFKLPEGKLSIVDHARMHEKMLQAHLDILKAQMPALEALNASLNDDQQKTFSRAAMKMMMEGRMGMHGMHGMHGDRMWMHRDGDDDMPPPPPAAD